MKSIEHNDEAPVIVALLASAAVGAATFMVLRKRGASLLPMLIAGARNGLGSFAMTKLAMSPFFQHSYKDDHRNDGVHSRSRVRNQEHMTGINEVDK